MIPHVGHAIECRQGYRDRVAAVSVYSNFFSSGIPKTKILENFSKDYRHTQSSSGRPCVDLYKPALIHLQTASSTSC